MNKRIMVFIGLLLFNFPKGVALHADQEKPFVSCVLIGQLGNQLFEIATTLAFAWDHDMEPIFPALRGQESNIPTNLDRVFFRLKASSLPRLPIIFNQSSIYEKVEIPVRGNQLLRGFFQNAEYFDHYREKIIDIFSLRPEEIASLTAKHAQLLEHPCTVAIHVRTFNKRFCKKTPFVGLSYYEKAIELFPSNALFVVFSDRINWCKHHFARFNRPMIFIDDQDHIQDLFLMSMLKHQIISNSTYSWWGAYFNRNPDKIVVAPYRFYNEGFTHKPNPNLPDWAVLDTDINEPYPEDIYDYDSQSKSLESQWIDLR